MSAQERDLDVIVSDDRMKAYVSLSGTLSADFVTSSLVAEVVRQAGVVFNKQVMDRIDAVVADYASRPRPITSVVALATPPGDPVDGGLSWAPEFDPSTLRTDQERATSTGETDHYAARPLMTVKPGDIVGTFRRIAEGADGADVLGRVVRARPPRASPIKLGRGFVVDAANRVVVEFPGVIELENGQASVADLMHVPGDVDFNSGNIDFTGAVSVSGGVKPCFTVKASGDVTIGGLVEDATVTCLGSLECRRGLTAKTRGEISVEKHLHATFMNSIHGCVGGNLCVHREIMNCELDVRGDVVSPRAVLLGGRLTALGSVELNELGSEKWRPTEVVLAWSVRAAIDKEITSLKTQIKATKERFEQIQSLGKRATPAQRESLTEMEFQIWNLDQELQKREGELARHLKVASQPLEDATRVVVVHKCVHPKVRIVLGDEVISFSQAVRGPLRISVDQHDRLLASVGGSASRPLIQLAHGAGGRLAA